MTISDARMASILDDAISGISPVLDVLAERDITGLKGRTFRTGTEHADSPVQHALQAAAGVLNVTDWPGTKGWSELSQKKRAAWWVSRIGGLNTVAVAYPSLFGAWTKKLPLATTLGFANQAMVLVAVGREYGVTDRRAQVRMLGAVLCGRDIGPDEIQPGDTEDETNGSSPAGDGEERGRSLLRAMWETGKLLRDLSDEVEKRPRAARVFRMIGYIPILGAPAMYLGERLALSRAANQARSWIAAHPDSISRDPRGDL